MNNATTLERVVIVGASSGIGRATAEMLTRQGYEVCAIGRDENKLRELSGNIVARRADASDAASIDGVLQSFGAFDHLVLAPSSSRGMGEFATLDLKELHAGLDGKLWPFAVTLQHAIPLLASHGSVSFVTAASSGGAMPGTAALAAINGALEAMVPVLAVELAPRRVNAVSPGVIDTPWWRDFPSETRDAIFIQWAARTTVGRVGHADDIADAIRFLIENKYITANILKLDGGARLR